MRKSRTGSPAGEAFASPLVATTQVPLPLLRLNRIASGGAAPKNVPDPARRAYRRRVGEVTSAGAASSCCACPPAVSTATSSSFDLVVAAYLTREHPKERVGLDDASNRTLAARPP